MNPEQEDYKNGIFGSVSGNAFQFRDIHGDIHIGPLKERPTPPAPIITHSLKGGSHWKRWKEILIYIENTSEQALIVTNLETVTVAEYGLGGDSLPDWYSFNLNTPKITRTAPLLQRLGAALGATEISDFPYTVTKGSPAILCLTPEQTKASSGTYAFYFRASWICRGVSGTTDVKNPGGKAFNMFNTTHY